ncbi:MAG: hypothetical protein ACR2GU_11140 [Rubrobacteraceae bacterium]
MKRVGLLLAIVAALSLSLASVALAGTFSNARANSFNPVKVYRATLNPLNGSGARGYATLILVGRRLTVVTQTTGLAPNQPHAQHIHGDFVGRNVWPPRSADKNGDGLVSTAEGKPFYGMIDVSLTTRGDTSPNSGLAVNRFPVAGPVGNLIYARTFNVSGKVARNLGKLVIVQHGIDLNHDGAYDGKARSSIDPSLPLEATIPADCGTVNPVGR